MGERGVRNAEVRGSIPLISTRTSLVTYAKSQSKNDSVGRDARPTTGQSGVQYHTEQDRRHSLSTLGLKVIFKKTS